MKILFVQNRVLFPANTGGKIRTLNILRHLARWHELTYLCNRFAGEEPYQSEMEALGLRIEAIPWRAAPHRSFRFYRGVVSNLASAEPFNIAKHYSPALQMRAHELVAEGSFDLIVCDFLQAAKHVINIRTCPKILFQHNVEAQILQRHAQIGSGPLAWYLASQWKRLKRFEAEAGAKFDAVIAVSENDKRTFERDYLWKHVHAIDTAVDLDYFRPSDMMERPDSVLFVGSMDWMPNQHGVRYFVREVWPVVRKARPRATFLIVGRNPPEDIKRLNGADGIQVAGTVPDVRPYLAGAAVVVVPLLVGSGTRLKVFEAMAMRKALVSTTIGAEGLPVAHGEHLTLADLPADFAAAVIRLLESEEQRGRLADSSHRLVSQRYGTETIARQFDEICRRIILEAAGGDTPPSSPSICQQRIQRERTQHHVTGQ